MVSNMIVSVIDILSLAMLLFIINFYTQGTHPSKLNYLSGWIFNRDSIYLILLFFIFFMMKSVAGFFVFQSQNRFVYEVASRISEGNLQNYLEGSYTDYTNEDSSVLIRKISQQPTEFCHYVLAGIQQIFTESILICLTILAILLFNAKLFLFLFIILLPAVIILSYVTKARLKTVRTNIKTNGERALQYLQEALSGFIESNIYNKNKFFIERFINYQRIQNKFLADLVVTQGVSARLIEVFAVFGLFILIWANKLMGNPRAVELVTIGAFIAAAYKIIPGIVKILNISGQIKTYEFTLNDLVIQKKKNPVEKTQTSLTAIRSVAFENVSFKFNNQKIIKNFDFQLSSGDFIGLSGLSGRGKTTVINLLLGFLDPSDGHISLNGTILTSKERQSYWNNISYVKQQAFLIYDTILNNISLGKDQFDEMRFSQAIASTGLLSFISKFPEGIQKIITENGKNISGGQRQRITIARALYKNADLIILDEPFNELDEASEMALLDHFKQLALTGKLVLLITHNRTSLSFCNKIISLDEE
jgi:ABC-type multidrug transport system fused ATPase/permease subunit